MAFTKEPYDATTAATWLVCLTCGTQFPSSSRNTVKTCHICDDPRQYVPRSGQAFTTLAELRRSHRNDFVEYAQDPRLVFIQTTPKLAIGQRAIMVRTPRGNILWDCIALLDDDTVARITEMGGLTAIVISHPHFYTTHVQWARAFGCPVYLASDDVGWTTLRSPHQLLVTETETPIADTGATAIKLGGHFPGSLVLLFEGRLLIADTMMITPAGLGRWEVDGNGEAREKPPGLNSYAFLWSYPNMIPLRVEELARMWEILRAYEFRATHGGFEGLDLEGGQVKRRVLDSMQIQARFMGYEDHPFMSVTL